jgi:uncharacterized protein DUF6328
VIKLGEKIKLALDESRMLILGAQILLGFQYRAVFEQGFETLSPKAKYADLVGLMILLIAIALIMLPGAYHRIVRDGMDAEDVHDFTTTVMDLALLPFLVALGIEIYVISGKVVGTVAGLSLGLGTSAVALFCWYGLGVISRHNNFDKVFRRGDGRGKRGAQKTELFDKVEQVLIEARVVLPGAQALLGFQLATILLESFDKLPESSQIVHLLSLLCTALSVILLMTPAAYHRIVERGEATQHFHRVASLLLLAAMIPLPLGICGDFFVVMRKVTESETVAWLSAVVVLALFYVLWFGFTAYQRRKLHPRQR